MGKGDVEVGRLPKQVKDGKQGEALVAVLLETEVDAEPLDPGIKAGRGQLRQIRSAKGAMKKAVEVHERPCLKHRWARLESARGRRHAAPVLRLPPLLACLALAGCGDHLGTYQVDEVRLVAAVPEVALDGREGRPGPALEIALSSPFSLHAADTGAGLYVEADHCPLRDHHRLLAFGPLSEDGQAVEEWKRTVPLRPDPGALYHYLIYVPLRSAERRPYSNSPELVAAYDLAAKPRELCLRLFVPGYDLIASRSDLIRVDAAQVAAAVRKR